MRCNVLFLQADALFDAGRSQWLSHQNSFNEVVARAFIAFLNTNHLAGARTLVGRDGRRVKYGSLLDAANPFDVSHPDICRPSQRGQHSPELTS